ncbi:hypothetical protein ACJJTC_012825 [Scirpophaga incertulas]
MSLHVGKELSGEYYPITVKNFSQTGPNINFLTDTEVLAQSIPIYDLVSSDEESINDFTNINKCQALSIKVVDCRKYPWYYKKYKISSIVDESVNPEEDFVDDLIKIDFDMAPNNTQSSSSYTTSDNAIVGPLLVPKKEDDMKVHKKEIQLKMERKKLSKIDFQKNTGLVGLKITPLIDLCKDVKGSKHGTSKNSGKVMVDKYILEVNCALKNVGTVCIPVSNSNNPEKVTHEKCIESKEQLTPRRDVLLLPDKKGKKKSKKSKSREKADKCEKNKTHKREKNKTSKKGEKSLNIEKFDKSDRRKDKKNEKIIKIEKDDSQKNEVLKPISDQETNIAATSPNLKRGDVKDKRKTNKYLNDLIKKKNEAMDIIKTLKKIRDACNTIKNNKSLSTASVIKQALCDDFIEDLSKDKPKSVEVLKSPVLPCNVNIPSKLTPKIDSDDTKVKKNRESLIQMIENIGKEILKDKDKETDNEIPVCGKEVSELEISVSDAVGNASLPNKKCEDQIVITAPKSQPNLPSEGATNIVVSTHQNLAKDQNSVPEQSIPKPHITCRISVNKTPEKSKKEFAYVPPNQRIRQNVSNTIPVLTSSCMRNGPDVPTHSIGGRPVVWKKIPHYHSAPVAAAPPVANPNAFPYNFVRAQSNYNPHYQYNIMKTMPQLPNTNRYCNNIYQPHWDQYLVAPPPPPPPPPLPPRQSQRTVPKEQPCIRILKNKAAPVMIPSSNNYVTGKDIQQTLCHDKNINRITEVKTNVTPVNTKSEMLKELEKGIIDLNYNSCKNVLVPSNKNGTSNKVNAGPLPGSSGNFHSSGESTMVLVNKNNTRDLAHVIYRNSNSIPPKKRLDGLVKDLSVKAGSKINARVYNAFNGRQYEAATPLNKNDSSMGRLNHKSGYSPPVLPIPTYQSTLDIMSRVNYEAQKARTASNDPRKEYIRAKLIQVPVATNVNNLYHTNESSARKISLQEYKKRACQPYSNPNGETHDSPRMKRARTDNGRASLPNLVPINYNHDQDLGYDSDVTIKI